MTKRGEKIAARARALVGAPYRPQGRSFEIGLDCVGVVAKALNIDGGEADYPLQGTSVERVQTALLRQRMKPVKKQEPGDVLLFKVSSRQLHLAIKTWSGFVHAHAGLRRVVETPGVPEWPLIGAWRGPMRGSARGRS